MARSKWIALTFFCWFFAAPPSRSLARLIVQDPTAMTLPFFWAPTPGEVAAMVAAAAGAFLSMRLMRIYTSAPPEIWLGIVLLEVLGLLPPAIAIVALAFGVQPDWLTWFLAFSETGPLPLSEQLADFVVSGLVPALMITAGAWIGSHARDARRQVASA